MSKSPKRDRYNWRWFWRQWARPVLVALAFILPFRSSIADWYDVPTGSMIPTILEGDRVLVNKLAYDLKLPFSEVKLAAWADPQRGDVVVFHSPADNVRLVKRVIGLPGDTIALRANRLFVNGVMVEYRSSAEGAAADGQVMQELLPGRSHSVMFIPGRAALRNFGPVVVPEGHYFVMGDNRDNSNDSRFIGAIPRRKIAGRAMAIAMSFDRERGFLPRFQRFFRGL